MKSVTISGASRGFTPIEMLVVLMIMGLFIGLVSTITQPDDRAMLKLEADRLSQLLDFAATDAQLTGKSIAWTADESGYRFSPLSTTAPGPKSATANCCAREPCRRA